MSFLTVESADYVDEMLAGFVSVHGDTVARVPGGVVRASMTPADQVAIVIGGGSGHYPAFCGFVGSGLAHGAAMGEVFASPSASRVESVARIAHGGSGVLLVYGNYAGDVLNFSEAQARLRAEGIDCRTVIVTDDVSSAHVNERLKRRGVAGDFVAFKIAGAAAESGASLDDIVTLVNRANERSRTMGVAFSGCTLPGASEPLFTVPAGRMGVGMGIHGEPGVDEIDAPGARGVAEMLVERLLNEVPAGVDLCNARVVAIVNGLGSIKGEELFLLYGAIARLLERAGIMVVQPEVGEFVTSFEMAGVSLTLFWLDDELELLWTAPAAAPAYRKGVVPEARLDRRTEGTVAVIKEARPLAGSASIEFGAKLTAMLFLVSRTIDEVAGELGRLDSIGGDGDHGIGMQRGSRAAESAARQIAGVEGAGTLLRTAAEAWAESAGGTSGALWGAMLRAAGGTLGDEDAPDAGNIATAIQAASDEVVARGGASLGDKTMVDAIVPFSLCFAESVALGESASVALQLAAAAASAAAAGTADLVPALGRARTHAEKTLGTPDPGAHSFALIVAAIASEYGKSSA